MTTFHLTGLPDDFTREVRATLRSPEYGHPALREIAKGTGPCRACLDLFEVGAEERLLFTYRPPADGEGLGAPGPVFIHAEQCARFAGTGFPAGLRTLPLFLEARASGGRVVATARATGNGIEASIERLFDDVAVEHLYLRHGEAGCHIARVDRGPARER
ncbi:MAG: DUF1203 domain-containing protein [Gemmatimonadales bacterium]